MRKSSLMGAVCALLFIPSVQSALIGQSNGTVLDTDLNIYWMSDANYAASDLSDARVNEIISTVGYVDGHMLSTNDFHKDISGNYTGYMTWFGAVAWVDQLQYGGFDDWRQTTTPLLDTGCSVQASDNPPLAYDYGWGCTKGEMGHLFYNELSGTEQVPIGNTTDPDLALFGNMPNFRHWVGTETGSVFAETFFFDDGYGKGGWESPDNKLDWSYVWAVRDASFVPIPPALWLFGSGLLGLIGVARRRSA